jgi:hypothetical protein
MTQLQMMSLVFTRLKMKFNSHASFHMSVNENDFPPINNTRVGPSGCLMAPFSWKVKPGSDFLPGKACPVDLSQNDSGTSFQGQ